MYEKKNNIYTCKDYSTGVLSVLEKTPALDPEPPVLSVLKPDDEPPLPPVTGEILPFLTAGADLSIPFESPEWFTTATWPHSPQRLQVASVDDLNTQGRIGGWKWGRNSMWDSSVVSRGLSFLAWRLG